MTTLVKARWQPRSHSKSSFKKHQWSFTKFSLQSLVVFLADCRACMVFSNPVDVSRVVVFHDATCIQVLKQTKLCEHVFSSANVGIQKIFKGTKGWDDKPEEMLVLQFRLSRSKR